jgi:two-component system, NtrC family, nitrogen regulation sensor histidine kinase NtrY
MNLNPEEKKRRRRELITIGGVSALFLVLTWILFKMFGISEQLPFQHSIFFFGLVNFNIILFLLLAFLIFRNVVKQFAEREGGPIGSSLKSKLIAAFVGFSFVPTALMFIVSVFYINNSFDRWFNEKISGILKSSIEVTTAHYLTAKKSNYHFADEISKDLAREDLNRAQLQEKLDSLRDKFNVDALEYYPGLLQDRIISYNKSDGVPEPPAVSLEFREKGITDRNNSSVIHHFAEGDLVRVIVPVGKNRGALVASSYIPMSLVSKMDDIASALENFRDTDPLAYPIKSIYLIILVLMTLVILLGATWFGFYLARQLSVPLETLAQATQKVLKGEYQQVSISSGSPEINRLIENFNVMTDHLGTSEKEVQDANRNLQKTLSQLDEHSRYIEIVLEHVTTGVISVNQENVVTMMNRHAERLLDIEAEKHVGHPVQKVLSQEYYRLFDDLVVLMKSHNNSRALQKEVQISVRGRPLLLSMTISILTDDEGHELGKILVFDDLTPLISAQRAAAWTEVARRIAHEIKNPLTPISLAAQRLQRKFADSISDPAFIDCTKMIIDQVDDLKTLVNEFSQFARMPRSKPVLANLNQTIADALQLFHQSKKNYALKFLADSRLPDFLFDPDLIRRALNNLVDNAVEGVRDVGNAEVMVETQYDPMTRIVRLSVSDNGRGIPAYLKNRIFEPYVTTKKQGTGLGLAIVKRTVEDHNGYVRALDNQPKGTRFVIELPVILSNTASDIVVSPNESEGHA